jgi:hypothetical protein
MFLSQVAEAATSPLSLDTLSVFVMMPFRPNLETFYRWSLKPYLMDGYGIPENNIRRADEVRDIGYIICEKICHRIQDSDVVLADVSYSNENVFYEVGLAYGLERPVVLMRNLNDHDDILEKAVVRQSLDLGGVADGYKPVEYPGVGEMDLRKQSYNLHLFVKHPPRPRSTEKKLRISVLSVSGHSQQDKDQTKQDIRLSLEEVLKGAIGVAMSEIRRAKRNVDQPWTKVIEKIPEEEWNVFKSPNVVEVDGKSGFDQLAEKIESSFCTVIDVSTNDPVAYFWLGYCHARGLNAIPVFRSKDSIIVGESTAFPTSRSQGSALAFDIRALWYAEFAGQEAYKFKDKIREILEHLLERDLPNRQKRAFWDRFPAERKLRVLTGAIHNVTLNREMVGDWDVRAVSELLSCLPTVREAMAIEVALPLYSPEEAYKRSPARGSVQADRGKFIEHFREGIENQLRDCNAIVVASPDVNPITEFLLHKIYQVRLPLEPFEHCDEPDFDGMVVVKRLLKEHQKTGDTGVTPGDRGQETVLKPFPRLFYREEKPDSGDPDRGFREHKRRQELRQEPDLLQTYLSQDECREPFDLLGHLVVARYPIEGDHGSNLVVLLNGVSGPATFGLAQLLTGGGLRGSGDMNSQSEIMLHEINKALDTPGCVGMEAIVKVHITPAAETTVSDGEILDPTYMDSRRVHSWQFVRNPTTIMKRPAQGNSHEAVGESSYAESSHVTPHQTAVHG